FSAPSRSLREIPLLLLRAFAVFARDSPSPFSAVEGLPHPTLRVACGTGLRLTLPPVSAVY
ncbi:MAG: hypothetical protein JW904_08440, partial [Spirochaetales bacterium]|nr:hypothetical protein [Spirochaetales bacterium]